MKKENFKEIIKKLNVPEEQWALLNEVDSIILENGRGIYPDWKHQRFLFSNGNIYIRYGDSVPYGAKLPSIVNFHNGSNYVEFPGRVIIEETKFHENFRKPKIGDIIRATDHKKVLGEAMITSIQFFSNATLIRFSNSIFVKGQWMFSFYDPMQYEEKKCMHSYPEEGVYMKFFQNQGKTHKKFGDYHEIIKASNIKEIRIKLESQSNKTYTLEEGGK